MAISSTFVGFRLATTSFSMDYADTGLYTRDTFDHDAVEVFKGPASTLFGRGSTGGVINQVTKSPELQAIHDAAVTLGTNDEVRATTDINTALNDTAAMRVDLMGQRSGVAGRPFAKNQRWGITPSIATGIGTNTSSSSNICISKRTMFRITAFPSFSACPRLFSATPLMAFHPMIVSKARSTVVTGTAGAPLQWRLFTEQFNSLRPLLV